MANNIEKKFEYILGDNCSFKKGMEFVSKNTTLTEKEVVYLKNERQKLLKKFETALADIKRQ